ncbi:MAG: HD-GYP domain-containing protein, partial [Acidiferrobacterales bacterium]
RKLEVSKLEEGMYVCELDRPWRETAFLFQGFEITTPEELDLLRHYCKYVYVDGDQPKTAYSRRQPITFPLRSQIADDDRASTRPQLRLVQQAATATPRSKGSTELEEEVEVIRETHAQATALIHTIMEDAHLGKNVDTATAKQVIAGMAESVLRNADALMCFTHLKRKDDYTALHSLRVCMLALVFGRHLGFDEVQLNLLGIGALLHDVGKMRVPDAILNKPGKLTEREFEIMKSHVPLGVEILQRTKNIPSEAMDVTRQHHERYSGGGYMDRLRAEQISQFGLMSAIVDVYDAITSDRVYQRGISALDALKKIYEWRGQDFHPQLVEQFIQCIGIFPIGSVVILNTSEVGVVRTLNRGQRLRPEVVLVLKPDKTPYNGLRAVDLARDTTPTGKSYEISKVVPAGCYGIQPVDYLPVIASLQRSAPRALHEQARPSAQ